MDKIKINVGGRIFETTLQTLQKSKMLSTYYSNWNDKNNIMFIDRSGEILEHVLSYMRDSRYKFPKKYEYELDYYDVEYEELYDENQEIIAHLVAYDLIKNILIKKLEKEENKNTYECPITDYNYCIGRNYYQCQKINRCPGDNTFN